MKVVASFSLERQYFKNGFCFIAGVDEAGRGSWAGPVVAGAVILGKRQIKNLADSKLLTTKQRQDLYEKIIKNSLSWAIGIAEVEEIDNLGIGKASILAMKRAILNLNHLPEVALIDTFKISDLDKVKIHPVKYGDRVCASIAAASIIAKVERDRMMERLAEKYPQWYFERHKGYGTVLHKDLLERYGPLPVHRRSFSPIKKFFENKND